MSLRRVTRSPLVFWAAVVLLAVLTWSVVSATLGRARAEAARFGSLRTVAVATRAVEAGDELRPGDVARRRVPLAFLPAGWLSSPADVVGRTAVTPVFAGQPVLRAQLAPWGLRGVAALLPLGTRAVAVPIGTATAPVRRGDTVDVLATFDPQAAGEGDPTFPVASGVPVVDVGPEAATVAVRPEEATRIAFAVTRGAVTLTVAPGPSGG